MSRLARFLSAVPRLAPEILIVVTADGSHTGYRIRHHWSGKLTLRPTELPARGLCTVVLDRSLPLRRRLQRLPQRDKERRLLLLSAPDEFPVAPDSHVYGLGLGDGEGYVYAVPRTLLDRLREAGVDPALVLVAEISGDPAAASLAAIAQYTRHGASFAIGGTPHRYIDRGRVRRVILGAALAASVTASVVLLAVPEIFGNLVDQRVAELEREVGGLDQMLKASDAMVATTAAARRLQQTPEARLPEILGKLLAGVPSGHAIRRIEARDGKILVAGEGAEVEAWLLDAGFARAGIIVEASGNFRRFRAERPL